MITKVNHLFSIIVLIITFLIPSIILASDNVLTTQKKLNELGFNAGAADGIWGNTTKNALIEYLSTKGLKFDGALDNNEFKLLDITIKRCSAKPHKRIGLKLASTWSQEIKCPAEVFVASDLRASTKSTIEATLDAAAAEWGNYGPVEYWVMGADKAAALELVKKYCQRRAKRNDQGNSGCIDRETGSNGSYGLMYYWKIGADALSSRNSRLDAGHNGGFDWGMHNFSSSLPLGLENKLGMSGADDQKVIMHEYFHAVQHAQIRQLDLQKRDKLKGPVWFMEGGAEYMASAGYAKLISNKKLKRNKNGRNKYDFRNSMKWKFEQAKKDNYRNDCVSKMATISHGGTCGSFWYDGGTWAIAYLLNQTDQNILLSTFYPNLVKLGWEGAFQKSFQKSSDAFYLEFAEFLKKSPGNAMRIIPRY
jgi:hypothetical protein